MAVTVVNALYPPVIESFQPAFIYNQNVWISFSISNFNSLENIKKVHVSVVDQRNNSNVLKGYIDKTMQNTDSEWNYGIVGGILVAEMPNFTSTIEKEKRGLFQYDPLNQVFAITLKPEWLQREGNYWNNNQYYQVQIRFDSNDDDFPTGEEFSKYLLDKRAYFSEWSSITLIKPILEPKISLHQLEEGENLLVYAGDNHINGSISFEYPENLSGITLETERLQSYRILAFLDEKKIYDSEWVYARQNLLKEENTTIDYLIDLSAAEPGDTVDLTIYGRTNNGYIWYQDYKAEVAYWIEVFDNIKWNNLTPEERSLYP